MKRVIISLTFAVFASLSSGCVAVKIADTAASAAVGVASVGVGAAVGASKLAVKGTTAAVGAVIPDSDDKKKKKQ